VFVYLKEKLEQFCLVYGERVLSSPANPVRIGGCRCCGCCYLLLRLLFFCQISIAVSLSKLPGDPKMFGSMAFSRGISGLRSVGLCGEDTVYLSCDDCVWQGCSCGDCLQSIWLRIGWIWFTLFKISRAILYGCCTWVDTQ
jgi:hypothetical protein